MPATSTEGAIFTNSSMIPPDMPPTICAEHGPSKMSYTSITDLDLTEDTSLPLNPQLHHLLLTELEITDIQACKAALSDPDTLTNDQVLLDPDIEEWKKSTHKEITQLESKEVWVEVPTSETTSKILPGTWVFHHMRAPTGIINKLKARYCVRGDLQGNIPETVCFMEHNQACSCLHPYQKMASHLCGLQQCLCPS